MNTFFLNISSPDGNKFEGEAINLSLRGTEGDLAIMAGHIPFITSVKPCQCKIVLEDETVKKANIDGGLLTVSSKSVTLLSSSFEWE